MCNRNMWIPNKHRSQWISINSSLCDIPSFPSIPSKWLILEVILKSLLFNILNCNKNLLILLERIHQLLVTSHWWLIRLSCQMVSKIWNPLKLLMPTTEMWLGFFQFLTFGAHTMIYLLNFVLIYKRLFFDYAQSMLKCTFLFYYYSNQLENTLLMVYCMTYTTEVNFWSFLPTLALIRHWLCIRNPQLSSIHLHMHILLLSFLKSAWNYVSNGI